MNLLLLDQFSDPGGAQRCLLDLLPAIRAAGWNALVGLPGDGELFAAVRELGFETARITCRSSADPARFAAGTPVLARQIGQLARQIRADLVYLNGPRLLPAAALRRPHVPVVFHSHSLVPAGMMRLMAGASLRRLQARVIGACRFVAGQWQAFVPPENVRVIYNGVTGPGRAGPRPRVPRIGCVGRIAPEKGQLAFVAAARAIHRAMGESRFVIHGAALFGEPAARDYEAEVRAAAAGLPVEFAGWSNDVYGALAELDVLLAPSAAQEATPRVILEAFAAGVPVIAFSSGGIPEVIAPGHDGLLVNSVEEMAARAIEVLRRPDGGLAERARETWRARFTLERYQCEVISALRQISS
ncbi:MAG: glycosyltransferase family 4 protein [Candidatus Sulfopaludibacter sp.]|nr:glycosyltransferase family 4 protein [Candidatus Sulfopaludibacter sp.]